MGSWSTEYNGNNTKCYTTVSWTKNADSVSFSFDFWGYCLASNQHEFLGNSDAYVEVDVDGVAIGGSSFKYAGQKTAGKGSTDSGWVEDYTGSKGPRTLPAKNGVYSITLKLTGNFSKTDYHDTESFVFTIPGYINDSGTIRAIEKAYVNVGGTIKECTVYTNAGGVIKEIS